MLAWIALATAALCVFVVMRYSRAHRIPAKARKSPDLSSATTTPPEELSSPSPTLPPPAQPYDYFCVLDVEGTCEEGQGLNWPNEIIEWPVVLLGWRDSEKRDELVVVDEWRSYVQPVYRAKLTEFCTKLTGITQADVDGAPTFTPMLKQFTKFLRKHGLLDTNNRKTGRWTWCTDGPYDIRDFVAKQCFISAIPHPPYLLGDILDVRTAVNDYLNEANTGSTRSGKGRRSANTFRRTSLKLPNQLQALGLAPFEGRQHSGIDDTRNIARIVAELARRGVSLLCNLSVRPGRRWQWMGRTPGTILEEYVHSAT
ncbi:hypothetical protein EXIGLDRAFT_770844 [Exidia glandulosa HHB12029]|uniref:Exonuclease domain-containing protein n=1 Tax=Exidia glandulosa HHB12029 TaxID=1314781 RepID=A0A165GF49_EXIGL|nr:hypothetical protein EXIGLDRAFT_770844 [Exidia glandulosa HHB12029]